MSGPSRGAGARGGAVTFAFGAVTFAVGGGPVLAIGDGGGFAVGGGSCVEVAA